MMGGSGAISRLRYEFRLEDRIPENRLLRTMKAFVTTNDFGWTN